MRLAIMQPYLFPYLGYFQLASAVDKFVFYDDVHFIKNGWINRNRILDNGLASYLTVPLRNASPNRLICEVETAANTDHWRRKLIGHLQHAYSRAPGLDTILPMVEQTLNLPTTRISRLAIFSVTHVFQYVGAGPDWVLASERDYANSHLHGQNRVLDICRKEGATSYVNLPGGKALYDAATFDRNGIKLQYISPRLDPYPQRGRGFVAGLSILDALMSLSREECKKRTTIVELEREHG